MKVWTIVASAVAMLTQELKKYDIALYNKPRYLLLNKLDLLSPDEAITMVNQFVDKFKQ